jgi:hypothetical protein
MEVSMSTITLHNLDSELDQRLRTLADEQGTSLNRLIQSLLKTSLGLAGTRMPAHDFSEFLNTWTPEEALEFEQATADFSIVEEDEWL